MDKRDIMGAIEAILYVAGEPVEEEALRMALAVSEAEITQALAALSAAYDEHRRGIRLLRFGKSVQLSTRPDYADYVERLLQPVQRQNLSQAAMETLAVIAYRQPATRGDVEALRGVKCDYSVQSLLNKGLIAAAGRRDTLGRPTLFVTTDLFLRHFGISSLDDLPQIEMSLPKPEPAEAFSEANLPETDPPEGALVAEDAPSQTLRVLDEPMDLPDTEDTGRVILMADRAMNPEEEGETYD